MLTNDFYNVKREKKINGRYPFIRVVLASNAKPELNGGLITKTLLSG